jgi:hypothetical protein
MSDAHSWRSESVELPRLYGTWPSGLPCALTVDQHGRIPTARFPLDVWTLEGEWQTFIEHRAASSCRS